MIKVGISGGASPQAGELLRILVNHPDVDLRTIVSASNYGRDVQSLHYGLIGDLDLKFADHAEFAKLDVLFVCPSREDLVATGTPREPSVEALIKDSSAYPELRIIDMTRSQAAREDTSDYEFGLSEVYRKPLVRGAKKAFLPYPEETGALISLYPLASRLLLSGDIKIVLTAPKGRIDASRLGQTAANVAWHLAQAQKSFSGRVTFELEEKDYVDALRLHISLPIALDRQHIAEAYDGIYDDHNFTFLADRPVTDNEVVGTNKCIITLRKPDASTLHIDTIIDGWMRGGAGEAVHIFNLLFGLHERTGLSLRASMLKY